MDSGVATPACDQRLAPSCCYDLHPERSLCPSPSLEVLERSNVVDLDVVVRAATLTGVGQEPLFEFGSGTPDVGGLIVEDRLGLTGERNAAPVGDQWLLSVAAWHRYLQARSRTVVRLESGLGPTVDLPDADHELRGQRLGQRPFHEPLQTVELVEVVRQPVLVVPLSPHPPGARGISQARRWAIMVAIT